MTMTIDPSYREYGLLAWLRAGHSLTYSGWADLKSKTVHVLVLRPLLWWKRYADFVEKAKAHEYGHIARNDWVHSGLEGDLMSAHIWSSRTDIQGFMERSKDWRDKVRGRSSYNGRG